jgi:hypothetical protein
MYEVHHSGRVIDLLREMILRNPNYADQIIAAIQEIDHRLHIYPQFGQPLRDLSVNRAQLWIGTVTPLVVHYVEVEGDESGSGRQVIVVRPIAALSNSGIV